METNGTLSPTDMPDTVQFNVSPKLSNSHNTKSERFKPEVLAHFLKYPKTYLDEFQYYELYFDARRNFKFVVGKKEDWDEVKEIVETVKIPRDR